jgi:hypothetical protein
MLHQMPYKRQIMPEYMKFLFGFLLTGICFFGTQNLTAQCLKGNCSQGKGTYLFKDGSTYGGSFLNNLPHGYGRQQYKNGNVYEGYWVQGKKSGQGVFTFASGNVFNGQFEKDVIKGSGRMFYKNGVVYNGQWAFNKPHGQGVYVFADQQQYEGDFVSGYFEGNGKYRHKDGSTFTGKWQKHAKEGQGILVRKDGRSFRQTYHQNRLISDEEIIPAFSESENGKSNHRPDCNAMVCDQTEGMYHYKDGSVYEGWFVRGEGNGKGKCTYANGDYYIGDWKNHSPQGKGTLYKKSGQQITGVWEKGQLMQATKPADMVAQKEPDSGKTKPSDVKPKMYAVIAGVALYYNVKSLKYTDDDAYRIYAFLKSPEGGALADDQIVLLVDEAASRKSILNAMDHITKKAGSNDIVFVYLSGHGLQGTFVPHDFDGKNNLITYQELFNKLDASKAKHKLFIADACHSGSMLASAKNAMDNDLASFYDRFDQIKNSSAFISSSKSEEVSLEHGGMRQGIFSHFLIRGLKGEANSNGDAWVSVDELYRYVSREVKNYTAGSQNPSISGQYDPSMPLAMIRKKWF